MARLDPHSYHQADHPQTESLSLRARVDFEKKILHAEATLALRAHRGGPLDLDTRDLNIDRIEDDAGRALDFTLASPEPVLGSRLSLVVPPDAKAVRIKYQTSPNASALQWLEPAQTQGQKQPFLFSQCQAIHARSVVPLQDTPQVRLTYRAELTVPRALTAVMAAAFVDKRSEGETTTFTFEMPQPIPPYLFAFAVGELQSRELSARSRVWAEPHVVAQAEREFAGVERMMSAAEALFGPYDWDRFDLLVMPPSFPYGGMENPRLTFLTPTVIAGDRSLVNVVAHELAHSWTGNLVSNANAEHFWLNEGFTVYAERRILERLEGREVCELHAAVGRRALDDALARFGSQPELTRLRTRLTGVDPDEAYSQVPYEKGYLFLRTLEQTVGRDKFDPFLKAYLGRFRFQSITTDDFVAFTEAHLPGALAKMNAKAWIDEPGLPATAPESHSERLQAVVELGAQAPSQALAAKWTPVEWQLYLDGLPKPSPLPLLEQLDARFALSQSSNYELLVSWLTLAAASGYTKAEAPIARVLREVGRMKYLRPLYLALASQPQTRALALSSFERAKQGYHPICRQVIQQLLRA